jgi:DivIVA domain-containing protein
VDEHSIQRIRNANFSISVRGYDRNEVDRFLAEVADWLETGEGEDSAVSEAVRLELERVGERTAAILTEAHSAAQVIRDDAARDVRQSLVDANATSESLRTEAGEYAADTRDEADAYARKVRGEADAYADGARSEAEAEMAEERDAATKEAERIVADANRRKAEVEKVISDLEQRREAVVAELERLASGIAGTATEHRAAAGEGEDRPEASEPEPAADATAEDEPTVEAPPETEDHVVAETDETTVLARESD